MKYAKLLVMLFAIFFLACSWKEEVINNYINKEEVIKQADKNFKELDRETR